MCSKRSYEAKYKVQNVDVDRLSLFVASMDDSIERMSDLIDRKKVGQIKRSIKSYMSKKYGYGDEAYIITAHNFATKDEFDGLDELSKCGSLSLSIEVRVLQYPDLFDEATVLSAQRHLDRYK